MVDYARHELTRNTSLKHRAEKPRLAQKEEVIFPKSIIVDMQPTRRQRGQTVAHGAKTDAPQPRERQDGPNPISDSANNPSKKFKAVAHKPAFGKLFRLILRARPVLVHVVVIGTQPSNFSSLQAAYAGHMRRAATPMPDFHLC
jgi:hypothetical protein